MVEEREIFALNLRSVAANERKRGREELADIIEGAADEIARLRSEALKAKEEWTTDGVSMEDYWKDVVGGAWKWIKYRKHQSWHPTTVKAEIEAHRGEPVTDVLVGLVFTLSINAGREEYAWQRVTELWAELRQARLVAEAGEKLREALIALTKSTLRNEGFDEWQIEDMLGRRKWPPVLGTDVAHALDALTLAKEEGT
jgi:hypothetical protein